jgi:hypothetical protein
MKTFIGLLLIIILFLLGAAIVTSLMNRPIFTQHEAAQSADTTASADARAIPVFPFGLRPGLMRDAASSFLTAHGFIKLQLDDPVTDSFISDNLSMYGLKIIRVRLSFYRDSLQTVQIRLGSTIQAADHISNINRICNLLMGDFRLRDPGRNTEAVKYQMDIGEIQVARFASADPSVQTDCSISVNSIHTTEYFCTGVTYRNATLAARGMGNFPQ